MRCILLVFAISTGQMFAQVTPFPTEEPTFTIPAVAVIGGQDGSAWKTELLLVNRGTGAAEVTLLFRTALPIGQQFAESIDVEPGLTVYQNVLPDVFGFEVGLGSLLVYTESEDVYVTSRTFNTATGLSAAEEIPGYSAADLIRTGEKAIVFAPSDPAAYRFNYGIAIASATRASVDIRILDRTGAVRRSFTLSVAPPPPEYTFHYYPVFHRQWALFDAAGGDMVEITVTEGAAVLYGSAVSRSTGHPLYAPQIRVK